MNETNEAWDIPEPFDSEEISLHMSRTTPHVYHPSDEEYEVLAIIVNDVMAGRADDTLEGVTIELLRTRAGRRFVRVELNRMQIKPMAKQRALLTLVDEALRYREYDALFRACVDRLRDWDIKNA